MALHRPPKIGHKAPVDSEAKFHIDYDWWNKADRDLRVYLLSHLSSEKREIFADHTEQEVVDWIDARTAEVRQVDGLEHTLRTHCSLQPDYITPQTSLVDAVFRVFLANGNTPLTSEELAGRIGKPAEMIQRTLGGGRIYKGIRPADAEDED